MCIITSNMSMIATRIGIAGATAVLRSDLGCRGVFRGMLQGSARLEAGEVHGPAVGGGIGEGAADMGAPKRRGYGDGGGAAGPSRTESGGRRVWEQRDGRVGLEPD